MVVFLLLFESYACIVTDKFLAEVVSHNALLLAIVNDKYPKTPSSKDASGKC